MVGRNGKPRINLPVIQPDQVVSRPPAEFEDLLEWIGAGIDWLERIEDDETREQVFAVLDGIDALHRHAIERLISQVEQLGGPGLMARVERDEIVTMLLDLYDLRDEGG